MPLLALEPTINDALTVWGFIVGVASGLVGLVGFAVTLWQVRETKRAALSAKEAAEKTLIENKQAFERFVGSVAARLLADL